MKRSLIPQQKSSVFRPGIEFRNSEIHACLLSRGEGAPVLPPTAARPRGAPLFVIGFLAISILVCPQGFAGSIKVISLAPNITEILFAIGLDKGEIVGVTDYCDYPKEARAILKVGSLTATNIERIVSLEPDYVFSLGNEFSPLNARLKKAGLNVVMSDPRNIEEVLSTILQIGIILHREEAAKGVVDRMRAKLSMISGKAQNIKNKRKVYFEIWDDPITSCGKGSLVDELITKAGGLNITGGIGQPYPAISQEFVIQENPDFIILGYMSRNQKDAFLAVSNRFGWRGINAVKTKHVISDIDPNIFLRAGPRTADGVAEIYSRLYGN